MATIRLHQTTTATPEQFLAGLTDFGPGRSKIFPNSADGYLKVHDQGPSQADVTEGSNGIWERLKGRLFEILLATGGKRVLGKALATTVKAIEARNHQPRQAQS
jgi:hypothetical protein